MLPLILHKTTSLPDILPSCSESACELPIGLDNDFQADSSASSRSSLVFLSPWRSRFIIVQSALQALGWNTL